jgi:hypothetical protein
VAKAQNSLSDSTLPKSAFLPVFRPEMRLSRFDEHFSALKNTKYLDAPLVSPFRDPRARPNSQAPFCISFFARNCLHHIALWIFFATFANSYLTI